MRATLVDKKRTEPALTPRQRILKTFQGHAVDRPPIWLMRQAGRCLPEYRTLRKKHSFRDLILSPELAAEVTLQPVNRFGFDAAILFGDVLVVPEALGQGFCFRETGGVEMSHTIRNESDILHLNDHGVAGRLQYVAEAIKLIKADLGHQTALLGFAGSPWTLANFMLEGGSSEKHTVALDLFQTEWMSFSLLIRKLTVAVIDFLNLQIDAGVDAVQIFDSLGGLLPEEDFETASGQWISAIIRGLNKRVPVIVYSKGTRNWDALGRLGAQVIGIDQDIDLALAASHLPENIGIQGNFDPELLSNATSGAVVAEANRLLEIMRGRAGYIFNLGHGVPPDARLDNLEALVATVQNFK